MKPSLFVCFLIFSIACFSQKTLKIKGCIKDLPYSKVYLGDIYGGRINYIDSSLVTNGCFDFYVSDTIPKGLYNIVLNRQANAFMRIIINKENIEFTSQFSRLLDSIKFTSSLENTLFYNYTKAASKTAEKAELLKRLLAFYPKSDPLTKVLNAELNQADIKNTRLANMLFSEHPNAFASAYIQSQQPVKVPDNAEGPLYLKQHFLDNVDFSNASLLHSDVLTASILSYLSLFENPSNTYREQVEGYASALDIILTKASLNSEVYNYYRSELTDRYRYGNFDILGAYLMEYYHDRNPLVKFILPGTVSSRLNKLKNISVGRQAPNIVMPTYDGKNMGLTDITTDYTLLVFWSTGCPHCTEMLPGLKQVYERKKGNSLEVLAISFDTDKTEWETFIKKGNYSWLNYSDLKGWNSDIAKDYSIQGTPTYLLLNKEKTVIYKPATLEELVVKLKSLNVI